jgi:hypothetical protein
VLRREDATSYVTVVSEIGFCSLPSTGAIRTVLELSTSAALPASFRVSLVIALVNIDVAPVNFSVAAGVPVAIAVPSTLKVPATMQPVRVSEVKCSPGRFEFEAHFIFASPKPFNSFDVGTHRDWFCDFAAQSRFLHRAGGEFCRNRTAHTVHFGARFFVRQSTFTAEGFAFDFRFDPGDGAFLDDRRRFFCFVLGARVGHDDFCFLTYGNRDMAEFAGFCRHFFVAVSVAEI